MVTVDSEVFEIAVYTKTLARPGWVGDPSSISVTPRHNQQPTGTLTLPASHKRVAALSAPGARAVVHYRDEYTIGGPVRLVQSKGAGPERICTFQILDDWHILATTLGWPVPGSAITAQSGAEYDVRTGPAETVVKGFLTDNLARLSAAFAAPVTIATDLGRGDTITVQARMQPLADRLFPLVDQAGIGVRVRQTLTGLEVDCYEPQAWPLQLSEDGGTLLANDWSLEPPTVTRVVVGCDGEGTARTFRTFVNTAAEAAIGYPIEAFVDARDIKASDPNFTTLVAARGAEALAAGAATAGLSLELLESDTFRYGGAGVHVGDLVTVELTPGSVVTDVLRSATLSWGREGVQVTPVVGERSDDPSAPLVRLIQKALRTQRTQQAGV